MTFLDKLKESALAAAEQTKVIAKTVSEKAEAAMEIQKLNSVIEKQKQIISDGYKEIGAYVYEKLQAEESIPETLEVAFQDIAKAKSEIERLNKEIALIKMERFGGPAPTVTCPECQAQISETAKFCPQCGKHIDKPVNNEQEKVQADTAEDVNTVDKENEFDENNKNVQENTNDTEQINANNPNVTKENVRN